VPTDLGNGLQRRPPHLATGRRIEPMRAEHQPPVRQVQPAAHRTLAALGSVRTPPRLHDLAFEPVGTGWQLRM
jgi:hypothetical protein